MPGGNDLSGGLGELTKYNSAQVSFFLIAGLDVLGTLTEFDDRREARTERSDGLGASWEANTFVGVREGEITQSGFYDDAAGSVHDILSSGPGATHMLSYSVESAGRGANFVGWPAGVQLKYQRLAERDGLTKAKASYRNNGAIEEGKVIWPYSAVGATGRKDSVDNGVSSTGGAGYLHFNASAGEANIRILHSSNDVTFNTLFTFTKTTSGHGNERITTTGSIKRYVAADFTTATATGAITALNAFVGLVRTSSAP